MDFSAIPSLRVSVALAAAAVLFLAELTANYGKRLISLSLRMPHAVRVAAYALLVSVIVLFGAYDNKAFIYFQF